MNHNNNSRREKNTLKPGGKPELKPERAERNGAKKGIYRGEKGEERRKKNGSYWAG